MEWNSKYMVNEKVLETRNAQSLARMLEVAAIKGPCRRESKMQVFTADFASHRVCMEHCQKLGGGRSPPVVTLQQWETFTKEVDAITPDKSVLPWMWVAAKEGTEGDMERLPHWPETIEANDTVWRDYYTGERMEEYARPWYSSDAWEGEDYNCLARYTDEPWAWSR